MIRVASRVVVSVWSMPCCNHQRRPEDNISMLDGHHPKRRKKRKASQSQELPLLLEMGMCQWKPPTWQLRHRALMCISYGFYCKFLVPRWMEWFPSFILFLMCPFFWNWNYIFKGFLNNIFTNQPSFSKVNGSKCNNNGYQQKTKDQESQDQNLVKWK